MPNEENVPQRKEEQGLEQYPELQRVIIEYLGAHYYVHEYAKHISDTTNIGRATLVGSKALIEHGITIGPVHFPANPDLKDFTGEGFFTERKPKKSRGQLAKMFSSIGIFPETGDKATIEMLVDRHGLNAENTVVITVGKPELTMYFPATMKEDYGQIRARNDERIAEAQEAVARAEDTDEQMSTAARLGVAGMRLGEETFLQHIGLYRIIQDAIGEVVDPKEIVQFSTIVTEKSVGMLERGIDPHGYAIDLSDSVLVEKIQAKTAELTAQAEEINSAMQNPRALDGLKSKGLRGDRGEIEPGK